MGGVFEEPGALHNITSPKYPNYLTEATRQILVSYTCVEIDFRSENCELSVEESTDGTGEHSTP